MKEIVELLQAIVLQRRHLATREDMLLRALSLYESKAGSKEDAEIASIAVCSARIALAEAEIDAIAAETEQTG